jgi:hypothetical protein
MSHYILVRRLRGPVFLLLIGVLALLHSAGIIESFWRLFWPLLLILFGVQLLAERAVLASEGGWPASPFPGTANTGEVDPRAATGVPPYPGQPTAIIPDSEHDFGKDPDGGQS